MHYRTVFREFLYWLKGDYIPHKSLLSQTKLLSRIFLVLLPFSLLFLILSLSIPSPISTTWTELYNGIDQSKLQTISNQDQLFTLSLKTISIHILFTSLILLIPLYLLKLRLTFALIQHLKSPMILLDLLINPFPFRAYKLITSHPYTPKQPQINLDQFLNTIFKRQILPHTINPKQPLLSTSNLSFGFRKEFFITEWIKGLFTSPKKENVLKNINLSIKPSSFTAIIGCNGSSKSVFLKTITKLLENYSGNISWISSDLKNVSQKDFYKHVSYVAQSSIIYGENTLYDYVCCGLFPHHKFYRFNHSEDNPLVLENLEKMELLKHKDTNVKHLSGGERQKAILALVLTQQTQIIVLDEPTTYLDINAQYKILDLLKKMQTQENKTIIVVLHDLKQVMQYADEVIMLNNGEVLDYGPTHKVINRKNINKMFGDIEVAGII